MKSLTARAGTVSKGSIPYHRHKSIHILCMQVLFKGGSVPYLSHSHLWAVSINLAKMLDLQVCMCLCVGGGWM